PFQLRRNAGIRRSANLRISTDIPGIANLRCVTDAGRAADSRIVSGWNLSLGQLALEDSWTFFLWPTGADFLHPQGAPKLQTQAKNKKIGVIGPPRVSTIEDQRHQIDLKRFICHQ